MTTLIKDGLVFYRGQFEPMQLFIDDDNHAIVAETIDIDVDETVDASGCLVMPALMNPFLKDLQLPDLDLKAANGGYATTGLIKQVDFKEEAIMTNILTYQTSTDFKFANGFVGVSDTIDVNLCQQLFDNDGILVYTGSNLDELSLVKCQVHVTNCNITDLASIQTMKKNKPNLSCDIEITQLLGSDFEEFLPYLQNHTVDMINVSKLDNLEIAFGLLYAKLVKYQLLSIVDLFNLLSYNMAEIFSISGGEITYNEPCQIAVFDIHTNDKITNGDFKGLYSSAQCRYFL